MVAIHRSPAGSRWGRSLRTIPPIRSQKEPAFLMASVGVDPHEVTWVPADAGSDPIVSAATAASVAPREADHLEYWV
jgi:hypothetical protein